MQHLPLTPPVSVQPSVVVAHTPQQLAIQRTMDIDPSRVKSGRSVKGGNAYTVEELRNLARMLNLPSSGNKQVLAERILQVIHART